MIFNVKGYYQLIQGIKDTQASGEKKKKKV
jgi:hypothetical protein